MMILLDQHLGAVIYLSFLVIGFLIFLYVKASSKTVTCNECNAKVYVEQMAAENCPECGARLNGNG